VSPRVAFGRAKPRGSEESARLRWRPRPRTTRTWTPRRPEQTSRRPPDLGSSLVSWAERTSRKPHAGWREAANDQLSQADKDSVAEQHTNCPQAPRPPRNRVNPSGLGSRGWRRVNQPARDGEELEPREAQAAPEEKRSSRWQALLRARARNPTLAGASPCCRTSA
jgi:hypothetical protein